MKLIEKDFEQIKEEMLDLMSVDVKGGNILPAFGLPVEDIKILEAKTKNIMNKEPEDYPKLMKACIAESDNMGQVLALLYNCIRMVAKPKDPFMQMLQEITSRHTDEG